MLGRAAIVICALVRLGQDQNGLIGRFFIYILNIVIVGTRVVTIIVSVTLADYAWFCIIIIIIIMMIACFGCVCTCSLGYCLLGCLLGELEKRDGTWISVIVVVVVGC